MRLAFLLVLAVALSGCQIIFKLPTRQGNVLEQKDLDALELGMSREQVQFLLGTPIAASPFRADRWDYVGYYKNPRGREFTRIVSLFFQDDSLVRMEGQQAAAAGDGTATPDLEQIEKEEQKAAAEAERAKEPQKEDSGVVISPPKTE